MDLSVHAVIEGEETRPSAGKRIFDEILGVSSGKMTKAEILRYKKSKDIYTVGPVI